MRWGRRDGAAAMVVIATCLAAFHRQLSFWFTGPDTFSLIRSSRIQSPSDLKGILTEPLMAGTGFTQIAGFFRPVTQLSFALDWAVWGLDPFGFHLTNVLLHTAVAVLVYVLARQLTEGPRARCLLAATFFSIHPVVAESVPAISRRQDALATLFFLAALLAYLRASALGPRRRVWWAVSLGLALLAFGSKETTLVLPGVILAHAWGLDSRAPGPGRWIQRTRWALARALPFILVAGGFLAWRSLVLGGLGGYPDRASLLSREVLWQQSQYLTALLAPLRHVQVLGSLSGPQLALVLAGLAGLLVAVATILYRGRVGALLADVKRLAQTRSGPLATFCLAWMLGGALVFAAARTFDDWSAYLFVVPLAIVCADLLATGTHSLLTRRSGVPADSRPNTAAVLVTTILIGGLVALTVAFSPSVHGYEEWETSGELQRALVPQLAQALQDEPVNVSQVRAHDLAWNDETRRDQVGRLHTVFYFQDFTLEDGLLLHCGQDCQVDVQIASSTTLKQAPEQVDIRLAPDQNRSADLYIEYR